MIRRAEQIICLLWIALAIWVCVGSWWIKLGTLSEPAPGFLPFGTGALLGILAISHLIQVTRQHPKKMEVELPWVNVNWEKGVYVVFALFAYTLLLQKLGYLIDTFLLMIFLFRVLERKKWWVVLLGSLLIIGVSYLVFKVWLMVQFPRGFLGIG